MKDKGREETDIKLKELEKELAEIYSQANKELVQKMEKYFKDYKRKDNDKRQKLENGEITADEYKKWRTGQLAVGNRWIAMCDTIAKDMNNVNNIARSTTQGHMPEVYAINHNWTTYNIEKDTQINTDYTLYNAETVERLMQDDPDIMPLASKGLNSVKDKEWNRKVINSVMLQGILQGESIDKMAQRFEAVGVSNYKSSVRYARTAITGTENAGRIDGYHRAEEHGIKVKKVWLATMDDRTRDSHVAMDGEECDIDEKFSNGCMHPGDPNCSDPSEVWNCRCTMITKVNGRGADVKGERDSKLGNISYNEWKEMHGAKVEEPEPVEEVVEEEEAAERQEAKIGGLSAYPQKHQTAILDILDDAPMDCAIAWNAVCEDFRTVTGKEYKEKTGWTARGSFYSPALEAVHLNISKVAEGSGFKTPYQTVFHEFGHNMDYIMNKRLGNGNDLTPYTSVYKDGLFGKKIAEEAEKAIEKFGKENGFLTTKSESDARREWNSNAELRSKYSVKDYIKENVGKETIDRYATEKAFIKYVNENHSPRSRVDISDMFEASMQTTDYPFGTGHGRGYWSKLSGSRGMEAFAEMYSSKVANSESWELIKEYFPESVDIFEEMLKELK